MNRRHALASLACLIQPALARAAPEETGRLLWGFPPGSVGTILANAMLQAMAASYKPRYKLELVPGAMARRAMAVAQQATPDGLTLLQAQSAQMCIYPAIYKDLGYIPERDFTPIACLGEYTYSLSLGPAVPATVKSIKDYVQWVADAPERRNIGVVYAGSQGHMAALELMHQLGAGLRVAAYASTVPMCKDMLAGDLAAGFVLVGNNVADYDAGRLRHVAVTSGKR